MSVPKTVLFFHKTQVKESNAKFSEIAIILKPKAFNQPSDIYAAELKDGCGYRDLTHA